MKPTSRDGKSEMKRAELIFKFELPQLLPIPSVGHATVVNLQFESGLRGMGLDHGRQLWVNMQHGSSSCNLDHACVTADSHNAEVKFNLPIGLFGRWDSRTQTPDWPHRACVRIDKDNETVSYFDHPVVLAPQQYRILAFYAVQSQGRPGPVPDCKLRDTEADSDAELRFVFSRIRRAFRDAASALENDRISTAAVALVEELFPARTLRIGYSLGRPELFQIF